MAERKSTKKEQKKNLLNLKIDQILPDEDQPRKYFDPDALKELTDSIKSRGERNLKKRSLGLVISKKRFTFNYLILLIN